ncbi:hypothetical protein C8J57DRAFT_1243207 [Mycena rebaudengoi]|nr:hypothetical protein C8J57DRAFT_1243207 [Mycena rebaudengoi]
MAHLEPPPVLLSTVVYSSGRGTSFSSQPNTERLEYMAPGLGLASIQAEYWICPAAITWAVGHCCAWQYESTDFPLSPTFVLWGGIYYAGSLVNLEEKWMPRSCGTHQCFKLRG